MSLATRCTACNTVFRVVQDQLKVSEGWVRCGRCQAVFNALEGLFDLEPESAPTQPAAAFTAPPPQAGASPAPPPALHAPASPAPASPAQSSPAQASPAHASPLPASHPPETHVEPVFDEPPVTSRPADFDATPASRVAARDRIDFADAQFNSALLAEAGIEGAEETSGLPDDALLDSSPAAAPEFLRQAERQARRERPRTVALLWLLCTVLALVMALQAVVHFRDLLATLAPEARPALEALCEVAGCRIGALRRIEDIVIESSALTGAPTGDAVRLSVVLRNRGPLPLAMPSLELTLTAPGGEMLARRALSPADFAVTERVLPAASEAALQLVLSTGSRRASGYTVEPFYP